MTWASGFLQALYWHSRPSNPPIKKDQTMKNFCVTAKETIYYTKFIKCEDEETLKKYSQSGDVLFDDEDITDTDDFELCDIEEMSFVNS